MGLSILQRLSYILRTSEWKKLNEKTLEVRNMTETGFLITQAAYMRKHSLGTHYITNNQTALAMKSPPSRVRTAF